MKHSYLWVALWAVATVLAGQSSVVHADYSQHPEGKRFIADMVVKHNFNSADVTAMLRKANRSERVLELISKPAEKRLEWKGYSKIFLTDERVNAGVNFWAENREVLEKAQLRYGVPASIIVDYPPRASFFRGELEQLFLLAKENKLELDELEGSYAGAFGMPQFISSSYRRYAVDFDDDSDRDLWKSVPDVVGSVGNYFYRHGWKNGQAVVEPTKITAAAKKLITDSPKTKTTLKQLKAAGIYPKRKGTGKVALLKLQGDAGAEHWIAHHNFYVITRYNHSNLYAMAVFQLSEQIKSRMDNRSPQ